ncbi:MAG: response regulator [Alphaproteobacteria bacterium]|nr:MAG: response regulator [Alphaproteobacteria bacterium]
MRILEPDSISCFRIMLTQIRFFRHAYIAALIIGIVVTLWLCYHMNRQYEQVSRQALEKKSLLLRESLRQELDSYDNSVQSIAAFFKSSQIVDHEEWDSFIEGLNLKIRHEGIVSVYYINQINKNNISSSDSPCSIVYQSIIKQHNTNTETSICNDDNIRTAMKLSKITGRSVLIPSNSNAPTTDLADAFLVHPIYSAKQKFIGWVSMALNYPSLFSSLIDDTLAVNFRVSILNKDAGLSDDDIYNYHYASINSTTTQNDVQQTENFEFGQRQWVLITSAPLGGAGTWMPLFLIGLTITLLVSGILYSLTITGLRAQRLADQMTVDLRQTAQQLEGAMEQAKLGNKAKSDFLATMSHEIRTPMNGIIGVADIMLGTPLNTSQQDYIQTIKSSAQSLIVIINDILDFSKMEVGKLSIEHLPFSLLDPLHRVMHLLESPASDKNIRLLVNVDPNLPKYVIGDPIRIQQILFNLIGNAIKFTEQGHITTCISLVSGDNKIAKIKFEVIDTGIGIPIEAQGNLFNRFTQSDSSISRKYGGSGLGLSICRQLVELMGGTINFTSAPNQGSTFWFEIVLEITTPTDDKARIIESSSKQIAVDDPAAATIHHPMKPLTILVAEDNRVNQMVIIAMLKKLGHSIDLVSNGIEAVNAVQNKKYDVVLMDVQMPEMDGITATRKIRETQKEGSKVPIIAITANAMRGDRENYLRAGMNDYVSKPINLPSLIEAIHRVCTI